MRRRTLLVVLVAFLALAFQGSRGLWEPDEGRNASIALRMLQSGDWRVPFLHGGPYLDKPPVHYWSIATGLKLLGAGEWGARVPQALYFAATALLAGALAGRMWDARTGRWATVLYATMLGPFVAGNVLTPDTPLAAFTVLLVYAYWRAECEPAGPRPLWWLAAGIAAGLGLLTKGPALLVFLPPLAAHLALRRRFPAILREPGPWAGAAIALAMGLGWYGPIVLTLPGAASYLLDNQVTGRLVTSTYDRNPGWISVLTVYLPTLIAGSLPWSGWWAGRAFSSRRPVRAALGPAGQLLLLWFSLPLAVFAVASSRLPLYLLPLFAPVALATARSISNGLEEGLPRRWGVFLAVWCGLLLGLKALAAEWPTHRDSRRLAGWVAGHRPPEPVTVAGVDADLNGLSFYGQTDFVALTAKNQLYPMFSPPPFLREAAPELARSRRPFLFVTPKPKIEGVAREIAATGWSCGARAARDRLALMVCTPPTLLPPASGERR